MLDQGWLWQNHELLIRRFALESAASDPRTSQMARFSRRAHRSRVRRLGPIASGTHSTSSIAIGYLGSVDDAEDMVQDALLRIALQGPAGR